MLLHQLLFATVPGFIYNSCSVFTKAAMSRISAGRQRIPRMAPAPGRCARPGQHQGPAQSQLSVPPLLPKITCGLCRDCRVRVYLSCLDEGFFQTKRGIKVETMGALQGCGEDNSVIDYVGMTLGFLDLVLNESLGGPDPPES